MKNVILFIIVLSLLSCHSTKKEVISYEPNIVIIYADDLGYGDISCQGARGVTTPHIDHMAENGLRFTDAHSSAATCTPSRFTLLTGSYAFRNNAAILSGSAPLLIPSGTPTLPGMLQKKDYRTAVIGKWHLGLGNGMPKWNEELKPGPLEVGFDYSFIIPATLDRVPTVYVEGHKIFNLDLKDTIEINYDHRIGNLPIGLEHPELLKIPADSQHSGTIVDSISRIGFMKGGSSAWWKDQDITRVLVDQVDHFINGNKDTPFFLYFSLADIHVPRDPNAEFVGKSSLGARGDAILEMDWSVGKVLEILKKTSLMENTLVIFSSDNGPILNDGYGDNAEQLAKTNQHKPGGPFNGGKYSAYEAGTRMPTIAYWPGKIEPGVSSALWGQVDLYASLAALVGYELLPNEAPDSYNMLNVLLGKSEEGRKELLEEAYTLALRREKWKYIAPQTKPAPDWMKNKKVAAGLSLSPQLYHLEKDSAEKYNIIDKNKGETEKMKLILDSIQKKAGTRPGFQVDASLKEDQ